ncbi:MAG: hypothetical protein PHD46_07850 [Eubacteriales bacterium]|nr:hypothetical protein [Eubacteriales bacterium]MDD4422935.1 hypothetical protein [Eubacteriales bacterium]HBR32301.1 hypothetical protein [Clostridiales bacterium]
MFRKTIRSMQIFFLTVMFIVQLCLPGAAEESSESFSGEDMSSSEVSQDVVSPYPELVSDNAVVVYNIDSNQVLYSKRKEEVFAPAAAAKLISMMVVRDIFTEKGIDSNTQMITATADSLRDVYGITPTLGLSAGDVMTAEELINASIVANENDACNVLAYYCSTELLGGEIGVFIERMNKKAVEIGATNSVFKNPTGINAAGMVTTPEDVALIAAAFYKYNELQIISQKANFSLGKSTIHTRNYLLSDFLLTGQKNEYAKGIIAGQGSNANEYTLITAVEKEGLCYIIVVMGASNELNKNGVRSLQENNAYTDMNILIPWTRASFGYQTLAEEGEIIAELRVDLGKDYDYVSVVPESKFEQLINKSTNLSLVERTIKYDTETVHKGEQSGTVVDTISAPVLKGQVVGTLVFSYNGEELGSVNLVAQSSVDSSGLLTTLNRIKGFLFGSTMKYILIAFVVLIVVYVLFSIVSAIIRGVKRIKKTTKRRDARDDDDTD